MSKDDKEIWLPKVDPQKFKAIDPRVFEAWIIEPSFSPIPELSELPSACI